MLSMLFAVAVIFTFHRMSWLVMTLVLFIYFVKIQQVSPTRLIFAGLIGTDPGAVCLYFLLPGYHAIIPGAGTANRQC